MEGCQREQCLAASPGRIAIPRSSHLIAGRDEVCHFERHRRRQRRKGSFHISPEITIEGIENRGTEQSLPLVRLALFVGDPHR